MNRRGFLGALAGALSSAMAAKAVPAKRINDHLGLTYRGLQAPVVFSRAMDGVLAMRDLEDRYMRPAMQSLAADLDAHLARCYYPQRLSVRFNPARLPA